MMVPAKRASKSAGFSLVEVIAAFSLLVLLVVTMFGGLRLGQRVWERGRSEDKDSSIEAALRAVEAALTNALPVALGNDGPTAPLVFTGTADYCRFIMLSAGDAHYGGFILVELGLQPPPDSALAMWTSVYRPAVSMNVSRNQMRVTRLIAGAASITLEYAGLDDEGRPSGWQPAWQGKRFLPDVVRLTVRLSSTAPDARTIVVRLPHR